MLNLTCPPADDTGRREDARRPSRRGRSRPRRWPSVVAIVLGVGALCIATLPAALAASPPRARTFAGVPMVGALFSVSKGQLHDHFCTASVVNSPEGDLVLTAAHCVANRAASTIAFVPDYRSGARPYGVWRVTRILVDQTWSSTLDPDDDFAFLVTSLGGGGRTLESVAGATAITFNDTPNSPMQVIGYPNDVNTPISCSNMATAFSPTQLEFVCGGYTQGTSGGPMLVSSSIKWRRPLIIGVIGGYQQGGVSNSISYAAAFQESLGELYQFAVGGGLPA
jgi:V8-like Glu-specific endopeptidase